MALYVLAQTLTQPNFAGWYINMTSQFPEDDDIRTISHVSNTNGFISTSVSPIATNLGRMVEQSAVIFLCRCDDAITTRSYDQSMSSSHFL